MQAKFKREKNIYTNYQKTIEWSAHNKTAGGRGGGKERKRSGWGWEAKSGKRLHNTCPSAPKLRLIFPFQAVC